MTAIDTNILVYAHREDSEWHERAAAVVVTLAESAREGEELVKAGPRDGHRRLRHTGQSHNAHMGSRAVLLVVVLALIVCGSVPVAGNADWTSGGTKDGVTLAFRDDAALGAREVRATSDLPFPVEKIFPVVCDLSQYRALLPDVTEASVVNGRIPSDYEVYLRYAPRYFVVAARDVVLRVRAQSDAPEMVGCNWSEVTGRAERNGTVRMPLLRGSWTLERLDTMRSRVVYQVAVKPGGRIPGWLVRRGAVQALPEVIENVRERLRRSHETP